MHLSIHASITFSIPTYPISPSPTLPITSTRSPINTHPTGSSIQLPIPICLSKSSVPTTQNTHQLIHPLTHRTALSSYSTNPNFLSVLLPSNHPFIYISQNTHYPVSLSIRPTQNTHPLNPSTMSTHMNTPIPIKSPPTNATIGPCNFPLTPSVHHHQCTSNPLVKAHPTQPHLQLPPIPCAYHSSSSPIHSPYMFFHTINSTQLPIMNTFCIHPPPPSIIYPCLHLPLTIYHAPSCSILPTIIVRQHSPL